QLLRHARPLDRLDRPPVEVQAGLGDFRLRLAEAQLDRELIRLHGVDRLEQPERHEHERDEGEHGRAGAPAARQRAAQPVLAAPDDVFQVGRSALRAALSARPLAPWATAAAAAIVAVAAAAPWAAAAGLIAPGHLFPL